MKIKPIVAGIRTITAPRTRLQRKLAKDGVMIDKSFVKFSKT
jgi:hypothetical protein